MFSVAKEAKVGMKSVRKVRRLKSQSPPRHSAKSPGRHKSPKRATGNNIERVVVTGSKNEKASAMNTQAEPSTMTTDSSAPDLKREESKPSIVQRAKSQEQEKDDYR